MNRTAVEVTEVVQLSMVPCWNPQLVRDGLVLVSAR
jgi:hypothetical protein